MIVTCRNTRWSTRGARRCAGGRRVPRKAFLAALDERRSGEVLDGLGHAACLVRDLDAAMEWWHAAYALYREEGDGVGAARVARNVAYLHGSYAGDWAVAAGWLARAQRQVPADDPSSERGWVALTTGMFEPDRERKHVSFLRAIDVGRSTGARRSTWTTCCSRTAW
jgi:hypothetical protein